MVSPRREASTVEKEGEKWRCGWKGEAECFSRTRVRKKREYRAPNAEKAAARPPEAIMREVKDRLGQEEGKKRKTA